LFCGGKNVSLYSDESETRHAAMIKFYQTFADTRP